MRREAIGAILGRFALVCSVMTLTVGMPALAVPTHVSLVAKKHVAPSETQTRCARQQGYEQRIQSATDPAWKEG